MCVAKREVASAASVLENADATGDGTAAGERRHLRASESEVRHEHTHTHSPRSFCASLGGRWGWMESLMRIISSFLSRDVWCY